MIFLILLSMFLELFALCVMRGCCQLSSILVPSADLVPGAELCLLLFHLQVSVLNFPFSAGTTCLLCFCQVCGVFASATHL